MIAGREKLIELHGVGVSYGEGASRVDALKGIDLTVGAGEALALRGRSGSGKTTLLHVMGGLIAPTAGIVDWAGRPLSSLDARARAGIRAAGVAYVFQGANLLPTLTAFENVAFAALLADAPPSWTPLQLLELVGLAHKADTLPGDLSGGEAQRVAIARAIAQQPRALLCDEPTGHLDSDTGERILDLVEAVRQELDLALVIATHDESVAGRLEREVALEDGSIAARHALL
jgi:putative ABC transport system ATP-binding protein